MTPERKLEDLAAEPQVAIVEWGPGLGSMPIYGIHYWRYGKKAPEDKSYARGDQIQSWVTDLKSDGWNVAFGWEIRGEEAPEDWKSPSE